MFGRSEAVDCMPLVSGAGGGCWRGMDRMGSGAGRGRAPYWDSKGQSAAFHLSTRVRTYHGMV